MFLACICFSGFLFSLYMLSDHSEWPLGKIAWLLLKIWFGSSYLAFDTSASFDPYFGPAIFVLYAIVSNTLLLTVLVSLLSNTYSAIAANAEEEVMFHHCAQTLAGVSTDALFSYVPPLNLLCFAVVWPSSYFLTPRWLHKLNVFMIRATTFPFLLLIHAYERLLAVKSGIELTAEKAGHALSAISLLPKQGASTADVLDAVFFRENAGEDDDDGGEDEDGEEETSSGPEASMKGAKDKSKKPGANKRSEPHQTRRWERDAMRRVKEASLSLDHDHMGPDRLSLDLRDHPISVVTPSTLTSEPPSTPVTALQAKRNSAAAAIGVNSGAGAGQGHSPADPATATQPPASAPVSAALDEAVATTAADSPSSQRDADEGHRRKHTDGGYTRGLGHQFSPLAKIFGAGSSRGSRPSSPRASRDLDGYQADGHAEASAAAAYQHQQQGHLLAKMQRLEAQNERLEAMLLALTERLAITQPPSSSS